MRSPQAKTHQLPQTWRFAVAVFTFLTGIALLPIFAVNANADDESRVAGDYEAAGTPVQLSDDATDAFYLGEGLYQSTLPGSSNSGDDSDDKWFNISIPQGRKAVISVNAVPLGSAKDDSASYGTRVGYKNDSCSDKVSGYSTSNSWPDPPEAETITIVPEDGCDPAKYRVNISSAGSSFDGELPVEIVVGFPPIVDGAEAGPENDRETPDGDDKDKVKVPHTDPKSTPGGLSYDIATEITPGTVSDTLVPGETKFYRMNVDWGQRPIAEVEFDKKQTDDSRSGKIFVASPRRVQTSYSSSESLDEDLPVTARAVGTPYVFFRNGEGSSSDAKEAGQWYVMVSLDGGSDNGMQSEEIEFRLSTALEGDKVDGPEWRQPLEPGPAPTLEPTSNENNSNSGESANSASSGNENTSQSNAVLYVGLGILAIILIAAVAVYFTAVRRQ